MVKCFRQICETIQVRICLKFSSRSTINNISILVSISRVMTQLMTVSMCHVQCAHSTRLSLSFTDDSHNKQRHTAQRPGLQHWKQLPGLQHWQQLPGLQHWQQLPGLQHWKQLPGLQPWQRHPGTCTNILLATVF